MTPDPSGEALSRASSYLARGLTSRAIEELRRVLSEDPEHARAHALLAHALLDAKRRHAAGHEAELALALAPDAPIAHAVMARVHLANGDAWRAEEHARRAIAFVPDEAAYRCLLADVLRTRRDLAGARIELDQALGLAPDDPDVHLAFAWHHFVAADLLAAREFVERVLREEPEHAEGLALAGTIDLYEGRVDSALELALFALRIDPENRVATQLLVGVRARQSLWLGLFARIASFEARYGRGRTIAVLIGAYVAQRVATVALRQGGLEWGAAIVSLLWLLLCVYTWVSPALYLRWLARQLDPVRLRPEF